MQSVFKEKIRNKNALIGVILLAISLLCAFTRDIRGLQYYTIGFNDLLDMAFDYGISIIFGLFIVRDFQATKKRTLLTITSVLLLARQLYWLLNEIVYYDIDVVNYPEYIIYIAAYAYITFLSVNGTTKTKLAYMLLGISIAFSFLWSGGLIWYGLRYLTFDVAFFLIAPKAVKTERIKSAEEELTELKTLFENGVIPEEEYKSKREKVLSKM